MNLSEATDDQRVAEIFDEQERSRVDELSCDFSPHECRSGKEVSRLMDVLDSIQKGKDSK